MFGSEKTGWLQWAGSDHSLCAFVSQVGRESSRPRTAGNRKPTGAPAGAGRAVREDTAFEAFAKDLADIGLGGVVVTLSVELACVGKFMPSPEMVGYDLT